jgi:hypothetical protein
VAEGQHSNQRGGPKSPVRGGPRVGASPPQPFRLEHLLLIDGAGTAPVSIASMTFGDDGIGVTRHAGQHPRVLPWTSVVAHAVEPWSGGPIPEWWVDPELNRNDPPTGPVPVVTDPTATSRARSHADAGALIVVQTATGIHRFILPGADARQLSHRVTAFAVRYQGPAAASSVTRVVAWGLDAERRKTERPPKKPAVWPRIRPYLVVALVLFVAAAITLILLQSAGVVHLPLLGGSSPGLVTGLRSR